MSVRGVVPTNLCSSACTSNVVAVSDEHFNGGPYSQAVHGGAGGHVSASFGLIILCGSSV